MKFHLALLTFAALCTGSSALADNRVFLVANQPDGYGIDQCLARGEKCGASAARSYCQSRHFAEATAYRRVDPNEVTGAIAQASLETTCHHAGCADYVAITCHR
jgi:hypothetical protein